MLLCQNRLSLSNLANPEMNAHARNNHVHRCSRPGCDREFTRIRDLRRHENCCHPGPNTPRYWCSASDCNRSEHYPNAKPFSRKDNCEQHKSKCRKLTTAAQAALKEPGNNPDANLVLSQDQDLQVWFSHEPFSSAAAESWRNGNLSHNVDDIGGHFEGNFTMPNYSGVLSLHLDNPGQPTDSIYPDSNYSRYNVNDNGLGGCPYEDFSEVQEETRNRPFNAEHSSTLTSIDYLTSTLWDL
ncbi:hypothetical protein F5884DRAFT_758959 [Xylogone sp. PMI_703]|nr:hypothetical protein F5884DRAFT_758959 [Xylogone sp. PMI_703]